MMIAQRLMAAVIRPLVVVAAVLLRTTAVGVRVSARRYAMMSSKSERIGVREGEKVVVEKLAKYVFRVAKHKVEATERLSKVVAEEIVCMAPMTMAI